MTEVTSPYLTEPLILSVLSLSEKVSLARYHVLRPDRTVNQPHSDSDRDSDSISVHLGGGQSS